MQEHLRKRFPEVAKNAKDVSPGAFGGGSPGSVADGQSYLLAFTMFTVNGVRFALEINAYAPGNSMDSPSVRCTQVAAGSCELIRKPDGSSILVAIKRFDQGTTGTVVSVYHYRTTGAVVRAAGYNYDPTAGTMPTNPAQSPLQPDQLAMLAADPVLGL